MRAIRPGDDRIEVQFGALREVVGEPGDTQHNDLQGGEVAGGVAR
jgi:hypothetical protein